MARFGTLNSPRARALHNRRRTRRLSLATGDYGLEPHQRFTSGQTPNVLTTFRAASTQFVITFGCTILAANSSMRGIIFEFGDLNQGCAAWLRPNGAFGFCAGYRPAGAAPSPAPFIVRETAGLVQVGVRTRVVVSFRPGDGTGRAWLNGRRVFGFKAAAGNFTGPNGNIWANAVASGYMAIGTNVSRLVPTAVPSAAIAPINFSVVSKLRCYVNQRPRHYGGPL